MYDNYEPDYWWFECFRRPLKVRTASRTTRSSRSRRLRLYMGAADPGGAHPHDAADRRRRLSLSRSPSKYIPEI